MGGIGVRSLFFLSMCNVLVWCENRADLHLYNACFGHILWRVVLWVERGGKDVFFT